MQNIIFEILPPPKLWEVKKVLKWVDDIKAILQSEHIDILSMPEVIAEKVQEERQAPLIQKHDSLRISIMLQRLLPGSHFLLNKVVVKSTKEDFLHWVAKTEEAGIRQICLVGKEKESFAYPGYTVKEAATVVRKHFPNLLLGGIAIFTRPYEARRMLEKMKAGITFFCSQIIFETENLKRVMLELKILSQQEGLPFPKIFVSLSPVARLSDIHFIKWLGAEFPSSIYAFLTHTDRGVEERSFAILQHLIEEIIYLKKQTHLDLGFNIEHVCYSNLQLAGQLIHQVRLAEGLLD